LGKSRLRAVVAYRRCRSAHACAGVSNSRTRFRTSVAPEAVFTALTFGQPHCGRTKRRSVSPKFIIARAAAPMFSPSCGRTRMIAGPGPALAAVIQRAAFARSTNSL
jgi:hypothetical protein